MHDLLDARQDNRVEVATYFRQYVPASPVVPSIEVDHRVAGSAGTGEEVQNARARFAAARRADAILHQRDGLRKIERVVDEQFLEGSGPMIGRCILAVAPPCLGDGLDVHALHEVDADALRSRTVAVSLHTVLAGFLRNPLPTPLPVLLDQGPFLFLHRPHDRFVLARALENSILRVLLLPLHPRNTYGVIVTYEDRIVQLRPVSPPVVRSRPQQVASSVSSVFVR